MLQDYTFYDTQLKTKSMNPLTRRAISRLANGFAYLWMGVVVATGCVGMGFLLGIIALLQFYVAGDAECRVLPEPVFATVLAAIWLFLVGCCVLGFVNIYLGTPFLAGSFFGRASAVCVFVSIFLGFPRRLIYFLNCWDETLVQSFLTPTVSVTLMVVNLLGALASLGVLLFFPFFLYQTAQSLPCYRALSLLKYIALMIPLILFALLGAWTFLGILFLFGLTMFTMVMLCFVLKYLHDNIQDSLETTQNRQK